MEGVPIWVPIADTHVTLVSYTPHYYKVVPAIWHPQVMFPQSIILREDVPLLKHTGTFEAPMNLGAAVQWYRDVSKFNATNDAIKKIVLDDAKECCICLRDMDANDVVQFTCHRLHWCCAKCGFLVTVKCPTCNFVPPGMNEKKFLLPWVAR